ncbi:oligomeric Golgi complex subunit 7 [Halteromyces radiatus]|uniref:oligomeric Golgi complex subunit 7 n=1 Tax=Halteromyces radiatus TaxID=101107 RepID=UPI0022205418|nr:oligomeric Golgi complex subunit 7 [Halteromyces radiatus]KAI8086658.1 oligomeric Golgi complex subunit 7 [Halteromyces radiatus]
MSTAIDVNAFSDAHFDVKSWINSSLSTSTKNNDDNSPKEEDSVDDTSSSPTLEQETATLITKLQLASEQASQQVGVLTDQVIKSMPRIMYDIKLITDDARATQQGIQQVKKNLDMKNKDNNDDTFEKLRQLHLCKTRMEDCLSALMEAENWNNLESEVSKVINNHDFEGAESRLQDALSYLATNRPSTP